jgi:hypothetical protein
MPDKIDEKRKQIRAEEHEEKLHPTPHNPAGDVEIVTANNATHEHHLQNKEINRMQEKKVDIHSDDKNVRNTHVPKEEQFEHDLKAEEEKSTDDDS